jgi:hypothetical protein
MIINIKASGPIFSRLAANSSGGQFDCTNSYNITTFSIGQNHVTVRALLMLYEFIKCHQVEQRVKQVAFGDVIC